MLRWIQFEQLLALYCTVYFNWRDSSLFYNSMRDYSRHAAIKEIQNSIVDTLVACAKFMNSITQKICRRPAQFVALLLKPLDAQETLGSCLNGLIIKPIQEGTCAVFFAIKDDSRPRHPVLFYSQLCEFASSLPGLAHAGLDTGVSGG